MQLFIQYLKTKKFIILIAAACMLCAGLTAKLYHVPMAAAIYPILLSVLLCLIGLLTGYAGTRKKHEELEHILMCPAEMVPELPQCSSIEEADYAKLVESLRKEIIDAGAASDEKYRDMIDYYTTWAHQIKTPIASMKLTLQGEDSNLSRKLSSDLMRTRQYVDMVLAFLRLGSEYSDYVFREYPLDDIVRGAVRKFASEFIGRKLSFIFEPSDVRVITDEKWLSFVLEQLLSNALKYTREGGIRIYFSDSALCMEDTGIGIAREDLPRVFEKGYTGFNGREDKEASGLGLYLCRRICDNLNHGISIDSEIGKGTAVRISFDQDRTEFD